MTRRLMIMLLSMLAFVGAAGTAAAQGIILRVSGPQGAATFSLDDLDALPQKTIQTTTPWHDGVKRFSGPALRDVLNKAGVDGATLKATALNDYSADLPTEDVDRYGVILATREDDAILTVRNKGPLFIMYPFDSQIDLKQEKFYSRAVWQVAKIAVR